MKKVYFMLSTIMFASILLVACNPESATEKGNTEDENNEGELAEEQVLNVSMASDPPSLHPGQAGDVASIIVLTQLFEGLTRLDQNGEPQKAMASKIEVSEDKKTYTFTIRDDAKWTNGDLVTAKDFAYAWKWVLNPKNADTPSAYQLFAIKNAEEAKAGKKPLDDVGIKAINDKKLEVTLEHPVDYFLKLTADVTFSPLNKEVVEKNGDWSLDAGEQYVTNGPFKLASWEQKSKIVFKKNESYWDADTVKLETINMPIITDQNTEYLMYQNGELDFAGHPTGKLPLAAIESLKAEGKLISEPRTGTYYYTFNVEKEPFNNANIRKAFTYAINRKAIVENITKAGETLATAYISPSVWEENIEGYFKDNAVEKAKEFLEKGLKELGYESADELPTIQLSYNTSEEHAKIAQTIQDMWKKNLGINVTLQNNEWKVFLDRLDAGDYQVARLGYSAPISDAYTILEAYITKSSTNYTNWKNETFIDLMHQAKLATDPAKRKELLKEAEQLFIDEMPVMPIYYYANVYVKKDYVHDVNVTDTGYVQYKWTYITQN